jgi:2-aminobenzoate-CoA ligase
VKPQYDDFARANLPPRSLWPEFDLSHPAYHYPVRLNCVTTFLDQWIEKGWHDRTAFYAPAGDWTYGQLFERVNQLARVLVEDMGLIPGNRVLLRSANNPFMAAAYLAVIKAGGIAVGTMPLLRAGELVTVLNKAEISHALCDRRLAEDMEIANKDAPALKHLAYFNAVDADELEAKMAAKPGSFTTYDSASDECCLIAFTSGTTGAPKGTMHFHRDMLAICDGFSKLILKPDKQDIFCGSPPLAFTFGLGQMALFSLHAGAATVLLEQPGPQQLLEAIERYNATIVATAPTAYRVMMSMMGDYDISSLKKGVSAGEHLPKATFEDVADKTGVRLIDGLGSTEMLHIFITAAEDQIRPGATGICVPGYQAAILDDDGNEVPDGTVGALAVKGPTGCRYLADERQTIYVKNGWNLTGDAYIRDDDGYFWYQARADDMIISAGYNISGPEVENALLTHDAVLECAVIGVPDEKRGMIVKAFVVTPEGVTGDDALTEVLQEHAKAEIAPYKYPRAIEYIDVLPKTGTGKLQRYKLKDRP